MTDIDLIYDLIFYNLFKIQKVNKAFVDLRQLLSAGLLAHQIDSLSGNLVWLSCGTSAWWSGSTLGWRSGCCCMTQVDGVNSRLMSNFMIVVRWEFTDRCLIRLVVN